MTARVIAQPLDNGSVRYWALNERDYEAAGRNELDWRAVVPLAIAEVDAHGEVTWCASADTAEGRAAIRAQLSPGAS
jgi:hypothetical protein